MEDICSFAVKQAEGQGVKDAEAYAIKSKESEVYIENNDLKQSKSHAVTGIGIKVLWDTSLGFSSVNILSKQNIKNAVIQAIKLARISPPDKYNSIPNKKKIQNLRGLFDKAAESFGACNAINTAKDLIEATKSVDERVSIDSGSFNSSITTHAVVNSNGHIAQETISTFYWSIMGMAIADPSATTQKEVSNFEFNSGGAHSVNNIDVTTTGREFAETVINSLGSRNIDSFKGEMLLAPAAALELIQDTIVYSINSFLIQKKASKFEGSIGESISSELLTLEDDATNISGLAASSFDREGIPCQHNLIIENGILKKFLYNTYTANKDKVESTGNAGGSVRTPPLVSSTNTIIQPGTSSLESLVSEMEQGIIINRFSGNINYSNGDFSGLVKGGHYVKDGNVEFPVREVMVAGNVFEALCSLTGISKERKLLSDSILPYMRFDNISFTSG